MAVGLWMLIRLEEAHLVEEVTDPAVATDRSACAHSSSAARFLSSR